MKYEQEDIKTITDMKTASAALIKQVRSRRKPILITQNGEPQAVLMDLGEYERQKNLLLLLRVIALGEKSIKTGKTITQDQVFKQLEKKLAAK
ncbi:MAG: type II toxin-antitoxin system Phd/YefM family antitoxin [Proteobacteria bacterium]|nr:MAG: type II toxin-antitoxin system Phd/YefM family antitoxin [Pseudomonadota bacterium]